MWASNGVVVFSQALQHSLPQAHFLFIVSRLLIVLIAADHVVS